MNMKIEAAAVESAREAAWAEAAEVAARACRVSLWREGAAGPLCEAGTRRR